MSIRETIEKLKIERQEHVESMMKSSLIMEIEDTQLENALNSLQSRHLKVKNDLVVNGDFILLDFLYALEKGNGYGTSFMKDFIEVANQHNQNILLKLLNFSRLTSLNGQQSILILLFLTKTNISSILSL